MERFIKRQCEDYTLLRLPARQAGVCERFQWLQSGYLFCLRCFKLSHSQKLGSQNIFDESSKRRVGDRTGGALPSNNHFLHANIISSNDWQK